MQIKRDTLLTGTAQTPCVIFSPDDIRGTALIMHGYGGSKEEQLGLAFRIAETGLRTVVIDLRGHGENSSTFNEEILSDIRKIVSDCRSFRGKVTAIGHSLGGRLALISGADAAIGISPVICATFGETTRKRLNELRHYRVNERSADELLNVISILPEPSFDRRNRPFILYGSRDIPEIIDACWNLDQSMTFEIDHALHSDIFTLQPTISIVVRLLKKIYN